MNDLLRLNTAPSVGQAGNLGSGWNNAAAFLSLPVLVTAAPGVTTSPIMATGLDSFLAVLTFDPGGALGGNCDIDWIFLRPDLTAWPVGLPSVASVTALVGPQVVGLGSTGRDAISNSRGMAVGTYALHIYNSFPPAPTLIDFQLHALTRP